MGLYSKLVLPYLTDFAMRDKVATTHHEEVNYGSHFSDYAQAA